MKNKLSIGWTKCMGKVKKMKNKLSIGWIKCRMSGDEEIE